MHLSIKLVLSHLKEPLFPRHETDSMERCSALPKDPINYSDDSFLNRHVAFLTGKIVRRLLFVQTFPYPIPNFLHLVNHFFAKLLHLLLKLMILFNDLLREIPVAPETVSCNAFIASSFVSLKRFSPVLISSISQFISTINSPRVASPCLSISLNLAPSSSLSSKHCFISHLVWLIILSLSSQVGFSISLL